ncbi:MAG: type I DNA topoisomerase, partial [Leptospirales bacterium]|nr:type I DNA topoisomerase [Leptospirales bacterium]
VEYWTISADLEKEKKLFTAELAKIKDKKAEIPNEAEAQKIVEDLLKKGLKYEVSKVTFRDTQRKPSAPFITSTMQREASNKLGYGVSKTMQVAQKLYEGIEIDGEPVGLITYMRTDSTRISDNAITMCREYIKKNFKPDYLPDSPNIYKLKKNAQDAHEAIRPSDVNISPDLIKDDLTRDQYRLYDLIWRRFIACQMTPEVSESTAVNFSCGKSLFRAVGNKVLFAGFTEIEKMSKSDKNSIPNLNVGDVVKAIKFKPEQHFTTPPPRFNDASLVKFLEESGIGRPSTYAPTIDTLLRRYYITRSGKQLVPTLLGKIVNGIMLENFGSLVSIDFTADMEEQLDKIEASEIDWVKMLGDFYTPFKHSLDIAEANIEEMKGILDEETEFICEKCGKMMMKKLGRFGFFLACSGFPECRNAKSLPLGKCPKCDGDVIKKGSGGRRASFYGCSTYPECDFITRDNPAEKDCPKCGKLLFTKKIKNRGEELVCLNQACGFKIELLDSPEQTEQSEQTEKDME